MFFYENIRKYLSLINSNTIIFALFYYGKFKFANKNKKFSFF